MRIWQAVWFLRGVAAMAYFNREQWLLGVGIVAGALAGRSIAKAGFAFIPAWLILTWSGTTVLSLGTSPYENFLGTSNSRNPLKNKVGDTGIEPVTSAV